MNIHEIEHRYATQLEQNLLDKAAEAKRNDMRKRLFEAQDNVEDRKDELLNAVEARLRQTVEEERLFVARWRVV